MRARPRKMAVAAAASIALLATACGGGGSDSGSTGSAGGTGASGGEITVLGCTPQNPLVAGNTAEACAGKILPLFVSGLVHYKTENGAPENDIAESIETKDNQNFTIKLKKGYKFDDGTEVKAKNFVDAWNYTALGTNAQQGSYFFEPIEGFADVSCSDENCTKTKAKTMSGLKVVDDYSFTVKTSEKVSNLTVRLGYSAFAPQPDSFFADPDSFKTKPIGAGPYKVDEVSDTQIVFSKNPGYSGEFAGKPDKVVYRIYNDPSAGYTDVVAGNLDLTDTIPPDQLVGDQWKADLPDRTLVRPAGVIETFSFSPIDDQLKDPDLRHAIAMAIDRDTITKQIFNGTRTPADSLASPVVQGYQAGACGEYCVFDAQKAKDLYAKTKGYKGTLTFAVNTDGGHGPMATAVCNSIKNTLGIDCQPKLTPDFKTLRDQLNKKELKGMFRTGWQMDYPSIENFLAPIYAKGASSNDSRYDNPAFDAKLKEAAAAPTEDEANKLYQEAEQMVIKDMPAIPAWYRGAVIGWSDRVTDVTSDAFSNPAYSEITVK